MNLSALEEWVESVNLPRGVIAHFSPVRDLVNWLQVRRALLANVWIPTNLQCLSSITEFPNLLATIQTMKHLNPLQVRAPSRRLRVRALLDMLYARPPARQMRRAVRDYKYEVNEGRMTEECSQYLAQLQKDWERHRVKLGVEALRREVRPAFPLPPSLALS